MTGKIYITDRDQNLGKIVLDNGKECRIMKFPASYESGDIAHVEFVAKDPEKAIISLSAESPILHYGLLLLPRKGEEPKPSLIVRYPVPLGLVYYPVHQVKFPIDKDHGKVSFRIVKNKNGVLTASNVSPANPEDLYKCNMPLYGVIKSKAVEAQEGYITAVNITLNDSNLYNGLVDRFSFLQCDGHQVELGFIQSESNGPEAYFRVDLYLKSFGRQPEIGERVFAETTRDFYSGLRVVRFNRSSEQVETFDNRTIEVVVSDHGFKIPMSEYLKIEQKAPEAGDIVWAFMTRNGLELTVSAHAKRQDYVFIPGSGGKRAAPLPVQAQQFDGFVEPEPGRVYRAYVDDGGDVRGIQRVNMDSLPEALDCYKSRDLSRYSILPAIETMIKYRFSDFKITIPDLIDERRDILERLVDRYVSAGNYDQAMDYELRLQELRYSPDELGKFENMPVWAEIIFMESGDLETDLSRMSWYIELDVPADTIELPSFETFWNIDLIEKSRMIELKDTESRWEIEMTKHAIDYNPGTPKTYYHIEI